MTQDTRISLRSVKEGDVEELYQLLNGLSKQDNQFFHPHPFDKETLRAICSGKKDYYYVMILDGCIIGYSMLRLFGYEIPSFGCCIHEKHQEQEYGTILTQWTLERAKELGYKKVILKTYKENIPAQNLYEKVGFKTVGLSEDKKQYKMEINLH